MAYVEFAYKDREFFRRLLCSTEEQWEILQRIMRNCDGTDIYRSNFTFEDKDFQKICGPLFFDLDTHTLEEDFEDIKHETLFVIYFLERFFKTHNIQLYFSGAKGFHIILDFGLDFMSAEKLIYFYKVLVTVIQSEWPHKDFLDRSIYDARRILRVTDTKNSKSGLYKIPLNKEELRRLSYKELIALAEKPRDISISPFFIAEYKAKQIWDYITEHQTEEETVKVNKEISRPQEVKELLPCIVHMLSTAVSKGSRNNVAVVLASSLLQSGRTAEDVKEALDAWNSENSPPLPDDEIERTVISANHMLSQGKGYGCRRIRELGLCIECDIGRGHIL